MPFAFSSMGLVGKMLGQLKEHKLFDEKMNTKSYDLSRGFSINLEGRNVSGPKDTVYNWFYQIISVKKMNFSPMMLIGLISHRFEIDPTKLRELLDDIVQSLSKISLKDVTYYDFYGLIFIASILNKNTPQFEAITSKLEEIRSLANKPEDIDLLLKAMANGAI